MGGHDWIHRGWPQSGFLSDSVWLLVTQKPAGLLTRLASVVSLLSCSVRHLGRWGSNKFVSPLHNHIVGCFYESSKLQNRSFQLTFTQPWHSHPAGQFHKGSFIKFRQDGLKAKVLHSWQREKSTDTQGDEKRKEEYGTWGMGGEEERKGRENLKVYIHHLCIKGVAVLACVPVACLWDCFWTSDLLNIDGLIFTSQLTEFSLEKNLL